MPVLALIGIGLMYGPIRPVTNAIGSNAAMDRECRENRRPAHLVDGGRNDIPDCPGVQAAVPVDVFDDDDRVVDEYADREYQREKRYPIDRETPCP